MECKKIGVIAGGPVDTQMGVEVLAARGFAAFPYPVVAAAREQTAFQMLPAAERSARLAEIVGAARSDGMRAIMVYCNSLSSSVDMPAISASLSIPVVTPLDAYRDFARRFRCVGLLAGNNQGLAGIERVFLGANPAGTVIGVSLLPMVEAIEEGLPPAEIARRFSLRELSAFFAGLGAEAIILGCTHFPYVLDEMLQFGNLPVIDPAERMCELLASA